jgi:hypothetical protein
MSDRFDELAKAVAGQGEGGTSRRQILRTAAGAAIGATLSALFGNEALAKPTPKPPKCKTNSDCPCGFCEKGKCQGGCQNPEFPICCEGDCWTFDCDCCPGIGCCPAETICRFPCGCCPTGFACCPSGCTALNSDPNNCGTCGNKCPNGKCCGGKCCASPMVCVASSTISSATVGATATEACVECEVDSDCGTCKVCQNNTCVEKTCDATKCERCDSSTGQCASTCGSCQTCDNGACRNCNVCETCPDAVCQPIPDKKVCGGVCVPSDWVGCSRPDLGDYCCPPGPNPCSTFTPSGCN